jgi:flagellar hook-associated protein 2
MATFDPVTTATQLATAYTQAAQTQLTTQTKTAQATSTALTKLQSALTAFDSALTSLSGKKSLVQHTATLSTSGYATATASATAQAGSYPIIVDQVATANQVLFTDLPAVPVPMSGMLSIGLAGGASINVDFSGADLDSDGTLSQAEIARAINQASDNQGKVSASVVTVGGKSQMILSATETGAASQLTIDASGLSGGAAVTTLKTQLASGTQLTAAQDAIIYVGSRTPAAMLQQASNTFTAIEGVSLTVTKAMAASDAPITLTVAGDNSGTASNVQSFVDAYNTLKKALDDMTKAGDSENGVAPAAFASDSSIRALRNKLNDIVRQGFGGVRLMEMGVSSDRDGLLSLDSTKLATKLAANPSALDSLFGSASISSKTGLLGAMDSYVQTWTNSVNGQIKRRQTSVQSTQTALTKRQATIDSQYDSAYKRYLAQFTQLQNLQAQMSSTSSIFTNLDATAS